MKDVKLRQVSDLTPKDFEDHPVWVQVTVQTGRASSLPLLSVSAYVLDGEPGFDEFAPRL